jgi:molybdopterin-containing oxidoreductase family membrane subunit
VVFGLVPALMLVTPKIRQRKPLLITAALLACSGVVLNRFVLTVQTLALPTLAFDKFMSYMPSWQETGTFLAVVAYGVLVYSCSFRYFNLFPEEKDLAAVREPEPEEAEPVLAGRF